MYPEELLMGAGRSHERVSARRRQALAAAMTAPRWLAGLVETFRRLTRAA